MSTKYVHIIQLGIEKGKSICFLMYFKFIYWVSQETLQWSPVCLVFFSFANQQSVLGALCVCCVRLCLKPE